MSEESGWAIRIPAAAISSAGAVRLHPEIDAMQDVDSIWLRGAELTDELHNDLRKLAADGIFDVADDGTLTRPGAMLPDGRLPDGDWQALGSFLTPAPQPAATGGELSTRVALRMERTDIESPASLLMTDIESWAAYAIAAPAVRLGRLTIAACADGRVIVRGSPLPPIRGTRFTVDGPIAMPCGWRLAPVSDAAVLRQLLALREGDLALFRTDASYERIESTSFAPATRGGARQTLAELRS